MYAIFISVVCGISVGCSNVNPQTASYSSFSAPKFSNGKSQPIYFIANYNDPITVSGTCDRNTGDIKISLDNGSTWMTPPGGTSLNCSGTGVYSITISDCSSSGPLGANGFANSTALGTIKVKIRSESSFAMSLTSTFFIQHGYSSKINLASFNSSSKSILKNSNGAYRVLQSRAGSVSGSGELVGINNHYKVHYSGGN